MAQLSLQKKQQQLDAIAQEIAECPICRKQKIGVAVPGEGNPNASIVFVGEAPGKEEAVEGRPFIGRAGKLLRMLIADAGISLDDVFITSAVKYLPEYVTPKPDDISHGKIHLEAQLAVIKPNIIVLLGNTAARALLSEPVFLTKDHGKVYTQGKLLYFLAFHPAAALHNPNNRPLLIDDFKKLTQFVNTHTA